MQASNVVVNFLGGNCQQDFRVANDCLVSEFKATVIPAIRILREGNISTAFLTFRTEDNTELCDAARIGKYLNNDLTMLYAEVRFPLARCGLCTEVLQSERDRVFSPLLLHCGHCICNSCLEDDALVKEGTEASLAIKISCPVCGVQTIMPRNSRLVPSEAMAAYSEHLRNQRQIQARNFGEWPKCQGRHCTFQAMWYYPNHNLYYCDQCRDSNPIDEDPEPFFQPRHLRKCGTHPNDAATHYCLECRVFCCSNCVNHRGHGNFEALVPVVAAQDHRVREFQEIQEVLREPVACINVSQGALRGRYAELERQKQTSLDGIDAYCDDLIRRINEKREQEKTNTICEYRHKLDNLVNAMNDRAVALTKAVIVRDQMDRTNCESGRLLSNGCAVLETDEQYVERFRDEVVEAAFVAAEQPLPEIDVPICLQEEQVVQNFVTAAVVVPGPRRVVNLAATRVTPRLAELSWTVEPRSPPLDGEEHQQEEQIPITNFLVRYHAMGNLDAVREVIVDRRGNENDGEAGRPVTLLLTGLFASTEYIIEVLTQSNRGGFIVRSSPSAPLSLTTLPDDTRNVLEGLAWSDKKCRNLKSTSDNQTVSRSNFLWSSTGGTALGNKCIRVERDSSNYGYFEVTLAEGTNSVNIGLCTDSEGWVEPGVWLGDSGTSWAWDCASGSVLSTLPNVPPMDQEGNPNHTYGWGDTIGILVNCLKLKPTLQWFRNGEEMGRVDLPEECYGLELYPAASLFSYDDNSLSLVQGGPVPDLGV